jgi:hypothetical protein
MAQLPTGRTDIAKKFGEIKLKYEFTILKIYFGVTDIVFYKVFVRITCLGEWVRLSAANGIMYIF